ncbi:MAG: esterase family protein [Chitinophagaceae bacterium]
MIKRAYIKTFSHYLQRDMEMLVFGDRGKPIIFFPTRTARFYDYENWKVIQAVEQQLNAGYYQIYCVDSVDKQSFYNKQISAAERIVQHELYENYILYELIPFIKKQNHHPELMVAGCSLGAYHATNLIFRHPYLFTQLLAMSGRYDLTITLPYFKDLFDGYMNDAIYYHMPSKFIPNLNDEHILQQLREKRLTFIVGSADAFLQNNLEMHHSLSQKYIPHQFYIWDGEAHKPHAWCRMAQLHF